MTDLSIPDIDFKCLKSVLTKGLFTNYVDKILAFLITYLRGTKIVADHESEFSGKSK